MFKILLFTLVALLSAAPVQPQGDSAAGSPMPKVLQNPHWEHPFWVSADAAFDRQGRLQERLFESSSARVLRDLLAGPVENGCVRLEEVYLEFVDRQPRGSIGEALSSADLVLHGKVSGLSYGFENGIPATLVRLSSLELSKGSTPLEVAFFAWPVARFEAGGTSICKDDNRYPPAPRIGDEVIAFVKKTEPADFPLLHLEDPADIVILRGKAIEYPRSMKLNAGQDGLPNLSPDPAELMKELGFPKPSLVE